MSTFLSNLSEYGPCCLSLLFSSIFKGYPIDPYYYPSPIATRNYSFFTLLYQMVYILNYFSSVRVRKFVPAALWGDTESSYHLTLIIHVSIYNIIEQVCVCVCVWQSQGMDWRSQSTSNEVLPNKFRQMKFHFSLKKKKLCHK